MMASQHIIGLIILWVCLLCVRRQRERELHRGMIIIITGGVLRDTTSKCVEVFNPHTHHSCLLPDLPDNRSSHTHCGRPGLLCGGYDRVERSCIKLDPLTGSWSDTSVSLAEERRFHLCWAGEGDAILLIGGWASPRSTELVSPDGVSSSASFTLPYNTV